MLTALPPASAATSALAVPGAGAARLALVTGALGGAGGGALFWVCLLFVLLGFVISTISASEAVAVVNDAVGLVGDIGRARPDLAGDGGAKGAFGGGRGIVRELFDFGDRTVEG